MTYIVLILTLVGIVIGADLLVSGSVGIARRFRISDFVIGAVIVGVGTSMPELTVSFIGALQGNAEVAIGNVVGSNIFNVLGILGITTMLFPLAVSKESMKFEIPFCIGISILLTMLVFNFFLVQDPVLSRIDGLILILVFVAFMYISLKRGRQQIEIGELSEKEPALLPNVWISVLKTIGGLGLLILSCDYFVDTAVGLARRFGVNDGFISITLIACGTSLPEFAASITAAIKKNADLSLGNIVGSNIFNAGLILGISSQVTPLTSPEITIVDYIIMIFAAFMPMVLCRKGKISRVGGLFMFLCFVAYNIYLLKTQML